MNFEFDPLSALGTTLATAVVTSLKRQLEEMPHPSLGRAAYSEDALAAEIGVAKSTLATWRKAGRGPRYVREGFTVIYPVKAVLSWLDESPHYGSTAEETVSQARKLKAAAA